MTTHLSTNTHRPTPLLGDRYVVLRRLGKGGAANVYLAHDLQLLRWRALKVMHASVAEDSSMRTRFFREATLMASIDHPNVVRVLDVARSVPVPFMVMEFVQGGCVLDWLRLHGAMPAPMAVGVALDIARALKATHARSVVHRDVKPHNVLVHRSGRCQLTDFGIAKLRGESWVAEDGEGDALTRVGTAMGTASFMPPEQQHNAAAVDERADIFALGSTLYTLLMCKAAQDLYVADPGDPQLAGIPESLETFILTCCRYRPEDRFRDADAVIAALEGLATELGTVPEGTPPLVGEIEELPKEPPTELMRAHVEELMDLVATGAASAYDPVTFSSEGPSSQMSLGVEDYTLTPMATDRAPAAPPANLGPAAEAPRQGSDEAARVAVDAQKPPASPRFDGSYAILSALVLGVVLLISTGGMGIMAVQQASVVQAADAERVLAADALVSELQGVDVLVGKLSAKGADTARMQEALRAFQASPAGIVRETEAVSLFELLSSQNAVVTTIYGEQTDLRVQIDALAVRARALEKAQHDALVARASVGGQLATYVGWIEPGA